MDLSILAAPDAKALLESPLGDSGWNLNKLLHRTATDPVAASRLGCAVFALAVAYVQAHLENNRLGTELADTRRTMNQAISEAETIRGSVAGMESGAIEAPEPQLRFKTEVYKVEYEHKVFNWLSEDEFRAKLVEMGKQGWKLVSHNLDLNGTITHYCVFGKRIVS